jgi:hypothetical protein
MRLRWIVFAAGVLAGCKHKGGSKDSVDTELARIVGSEALGTIEAALAAAKAGVGHSPEAAFESCHTATAIVPQLRLGPEVALADKLEQLCARDLPLAELAVAVTAVEADAGACATTAYASAAIALLREAEASPLAKRYRARCPT